MKYLLSFSVLSLILVLSLGAYVEKDPEMNNKRGVIDLDHLFNYANQFVPEKAIFNHNVSNPITDETATLGRVLFYDKKLSLNGTTSCSSCHQQEHAFGDTSIVSRGFDGKLTERHAMRLINVGFSFDHLRFWDKRGEGLERTVTEPFKNDIEMGFSGTDGMPGFDSLLSKMHTLNYYKPLFEKAFGDDDVTERRMQIALAHFIRSIISFDSKFDEGFAQAATELDTFSNYTKMENEGKRLFFTNSFFNERDPNTAGAFCGVCHKMPGFAILHLSMNNGVIGVAGDPDAVDVSVERSPSLRNLVKIDGSSLGPFMHDGSFSTLEEVIDHYDSIPSNPANTNLSGLLFPDNNRSVDLKLSQDQKEALVAFLKTLTGSDVFMNEKWSDPFDDSGNLTVRRGCSDVEFSFQISICEGQEFEGFTEAGIYRTTFQTALGCDSIREVELIVFPTAEEIVQVEICDGESFEGYSLSGEYVDLFMSSSGCDSIRRLELRILDASDQRCTITSTLDIDDKLEYRIFPNPFADQFYFSNIPDGRYEMTVFDRIGRLITVEEIRVSGDSSFDIPSATIGLYFIKLVSSDGAQIYSLRATRF